MNVEDMKRMERKREIKAQIEALEAELGSIESQEREAVQLWRNRHEYRLA